MKNFDLVTSHNITIEYQLASILERFLALFIDLCILMVWAWVASGIAQSYAGNSWFDRGPDYELYYKMIFSFIFMPVFFFYNLFFEIFVSGASPGKMIMGIKVINFNGQNPNISECFLRWTFRPVELLLTAGGLAAIFVSSSEKAQRIGDMVARTVVIKLRPTLKYSLKDVMSIKTSNEYQPKNLNVVKFTESEMLYVKNCIDRARRYPNPSSRKLLQELTMKICEQLNIKEVPEAKKQPDFLRSLIQDYVVLTRS
ncbi:MAG TPA: RDD family protein [Flavobacteriales bacterium]|nr:RDD family protein [Flavobacteriales bacterium]